MITRYSMDTEYWPGDNYIEVVPRKELEGEWVSHSDFMKAVEELEYELRAMDEKVFEAHEEAQHWRELYNSLYEQQQL